MLVSVNVGLPTNVAWQGKTVFTFSPDPLEPPADGQVLICCARPSADVVLDM